MRRRADAPVQRMYRFRMSGLVYLAVTGFLAVAAISSQNNLLFWALRARGRGHRCVGCDLRARADGDPGRARADPRRLGR